VRFLAIDTHWSSARGGVSTFNRELCLALARAGADVCCLVLEARPEEVSAAGDLGVRLIGAGLRPGWKERELLTLPPRLPEGWLPQVIIGHGRVTGRFAEAHREDRFGGAAYFHFVHTDPERMGGDRAETKWEEELPLMAGADRVLAVGPALWRRAESDLRPLHEASVPIRIDPGFDLVGKPAKCPPPGGARKILVAGRLEDYDIKGLDVAARAVAGAINLCAGSTRGVALLLRGVPQEERAETEAKVLLWAGIDLDVDLHRYSDKPLDMQQDLGRSVLVLLPSRAEGFGLVGREAIVAGVPVLVSCRSGLGELLELLSDEAADLAEGLVLPVNRDGQDVQPWSKAIAAVLDRPGPAFDRAAKLREWMSRKRSWAEAAQRVLQAWAVAPRRIGRDPAKKLPCRTALLCTDGDAGRDFLARLHLVLRDMVDHIDPEVAPDDGGPIAWSPDVVLCVLGEDNRGDGRPAAGLTDVLTEARRLDRPVVLLRIKPDAAPPTEVPGSHTIDATGDFLEALGKLSEHLASLDDDRSPAVEEALGPVTVSAEPPTASSRPAPHGFLPINEMPAIASAGFHDRADTIAVILRELAGTKYRLIVLSGQDGVGKTAVVRAIRDGQEEAEEPSLRSLLYFSARGYRWISPPALLADLVGLAEESDREPLLSEVRTAPWEAVADKVLAKVGTAPIAVVIDDADRLFNNDGDWTDLDIRDLVTRLVGKGGHPVSVLMLVRKVPAALRALPLRRHMLPVDLEDGLPFHPYAEDLLRKMDDERGTLGLATASTAQLERLHNGTAGLPRSMELVAGLLTLNRSQTVDHVADLLDDADDRPRALFTEIFGRLQLEERRVLQALAVFVRPVPADAVASLLAEAHPTLRAAASLEYLRHARVVHSYGDRYYLPARQADLALSTLPSQESAGSASQLTKEHLRQRGVAYFHSHRQEQVFAIGELWPQFGEIELLMRTQDWDQTLTVMNEIDDTYLSRWGQSYALASWREELKDVLEGPESRGANLSYLRAAARQYDGDTGGVEDINRARELARELGDRKNVIVTTIQLANLLADRGELAEAAEEYREAIDESQIYGQFKYEANARTGLATCAAKHGDFDRAEHEMDEVARLNDEMGPSPQGDDRRASQLVNQAWLRGERGDHDTAYGLLLKARVLAERLCSDARSAWVLGGLAKNALAKGDNEGAIRLSQDGARIAQRLDNHRLLREINVTRGFALLAAGNLTAAAEVAEIAAGYASRATAGVARARLPGRGGACLPPGPPSHPGAGGTSSQRVPAQPLRRLRGPEHPGHGQGRCRSRLLARRPRPTPIVALRGEGRPGRPTVPRSTPGWRRWSQAAGP
jgi:glycosyltransferase involved in cell wall biosynthesis/tetratricopeptide (TPR) repeat protein